MNEHNLSLSMCNINNNNILNHNTNKISIINNNNTLRKGGVGILEVEDSNKEEGLVEEEANSYVIIVGIEDILPEIVKVL